MQPTPVAMPGKSHGQRNLVGYSPQGRLEKLSIAFWKTVQQLFKVLNKNDTWPNSSTPGYIPKRDINMFTQKLVYIKQIDGGNLLYGTESSAWCSVVNQRGGQGRVQGPRETEICMYVRMYVYECVYTQLIHAVVQQKLTQHCKETIPQFFLKKLFLAPLFIIAKQ